MKKLMTCLLALVLVLSLTACGGKDDSSASGDDANAPSVEDTSTGDDANSGDDAASGEFTTIEDGKLLMATNASFPPYEMTDDSNKVVGIDPEIAAAIAEKLGLELVIDDIDFDAALMAVQQGKSDIVMAGLSYREDRDLVLDFSDSYATGVQVIIVKEGDTTIAGTNDNLQLIDADGNVLEDIQIGVQRGTTGAIYCQDAHGEDHVSSLDNGSVAVQALLNGQVDCVVIDNGPAQEYVKANPGLEILEAEYVIEDYCIAVNEGNTALLDAVNGALKELIADGTVQQIIDKYISAE